MPKPSVSIKAGFSHQDGGTLAGGGAVPVDDFGVYPFDRNIRLYMPYTE